MAVLYCRRNGETETDPIFRCVHWFCRLAWPSQPKGNRPIRVQDRESEIFRPLTGHQPDLEAGRHAQALARSQARRRFLEITFRVLHSEAEGPEWVKAQNGATGVLSGLEGAVRLTDPGLGSSQPGELAPPACGAASPEPRGNTDQR